MSKTTVIHHSADFDGIFCREIARKFLPEAELIGWDFKDEPLPIPDGQIYILDLPVDRVFGINIENAWQGCFGSDADIVWIDHHKSSIESHPSEIPGYRIDGVAACRLAWQWFTNASNRPCTCDVPDSEGHYDYCLKMVMPVKEEYTTRKVSEPLAVRLAGEYDIWDKRDPNAELFQHGLKSQHLGEDEWTLLLSNPLTHDTEYDIVSRLLRQGRALQFARTKENASVINEIGFTFQWEGLTFLACNSARYNSLLFTAGLKPEHDACFGFKWTGTRWSVSLYHAPGKEHHDLSLIAVKYGGGGHRGACGFTTQEPLPFLP